MTNRYWDASLWRTDDKDWLENRKQEWKHVQFNLKVFSRTTIRGSYLKHHKKLFFKGEISDDLFLSDGHREFYFILPFFVMWYHPALNATVTDEIVSWCSEKDVSTATSLVSAREFVSNFRQRRTHLDPEYGFMGGKEQAITLALWGNNYFWGTQNPETKFDKVIYQYHLDQRGKHFYQQFALAAMNISNAFWGSARTILRKGKFHRYNVGQYLYKHALQATRCEHWEEHEQIKIVASDVLHCGDSPHFNQDDEYSRVFKGLMLERYNNGEFPEPIQSIWDAVKKGDVNFGDW